MEKIFVAGSDGQLALSLIEAAKDAPYEIITAGPPEFDLTKPAALAAYVKKHAPDAIINAAAYTAVDAAEENEAVALLINSDGAAALASIASELDIPFIHVSTDYVFSGNKEGSYTENDAVSPNGAYGRTKLAGELAVMVNNPNSIILRTSWVYSPFGKNFLKTMLKLAENRDELGVVADQTGNPTYAPDIADAILHILEGIEDEGWHDGYAGVYHLSGKGDTSWHGFASEIFEQGAIHGHPKPTVNAITTEDFPTPAKRPANSCLDCSKVQQIFSIEMPAWQESTARCVKRLFEEGGLE